VAGLIEAEGEGMRARCYYQRAGCDCPAKKATAIDVEVAVANHRRYRKS
jgi:hypothetical protein